MSKNIEAQLSRLADEYSEKARGPSPGWVGAEVVAKQLRALLPSPSLIGCSKGILCGDVACECNGNGFIERPATPTESLESKRAKFEAWVMRVEHKPYGWLDRRVLARSDDGEGYVDDYVHGCWTALNANLDLSQDLPTAAQPSGQDESTVMSVEDLGSDAKCALCYDTGSIVIDDTKAEYVMATCPECRPADTRPTFVDLIEDAEEEIKRIAAERGVEIEKVYPTNLTLRNASATIRALMHAANIRRAGDQFGLSDTAAQIIQDIREHEPQDEVDSLHIGISALELILLQRLENFQLPEPTQTGPQLVAHWTDHSMVSLRINDQVRTYTEVGASHRVDASRSNDTALRRALRLLKGIDDGCNEVKTLRRLVESAQHQGQSIIAHVCSYTPGMNMVEFRLPKSAPIPQWLEMGARITLVEDLPVVEVSNEQ